jgi:hypothetical protein
MSVCWRTRWTNSRVANQPHSEMGAIAKTQGSSYGKPSSSKLDKAGWWQGYLNPNWIKRARITFV